ncbi:MAG: sugar kinase [Methanobacteriota archaeon]|nr:MAG: sugar kinase [Euryarchaeota archaeon]
MDVLIVGSIAYDSLETPLGLSEDELGGSATYAGFSSAFHNHRLGGDGISMVGVVGKDFQPQHLSWFIEAGLDISGIETALGDTFRWKGSYHGNMAEAITHETHLNVFETFQPQVPEHALSPKVLFCANLHPSLQASVLDQTSPTRLTLLDSMNLWIDIAYDGLIEVMKRVDIVVLNDGEVRLLANDQNLVRAAHTLQEMMEGGILVVKRGEHGVLALHPDGILSQPAYPALKIVDPTGCGDTFAGTLAAHLSKGVGEVGRKELAEALFHATVTASFTLETFGCDRIRNLSAGEYESRLIDFRHISNSNGF